MLSPTVGSKKTENSKQFAFLLVKLTDKFKYYFDKIGFYIYAKLRE